MTLPSCNKWRPRQANGDSIVRILFIVFILGVLMSGLWEVIAPFTSDDVNECTNPSAELNTTGHAASGTNTIAASTEQQYRGAKSFKITYQDNTTLDTIAHTFLNASVTYYVKLKVYVPANWNGTTLTIGGSGFTGATITPVTTWTTGGVTATWVELKSTFALGADVSGNLALTTSGTPTAGRSIYIDALYISMNDGEYFDGEDFMAFWKGNRHASASQMDYRNRKHGQAVNLDNYQVFAGFPIGFDFPRFNHATRERAIGRGSEYLNTYIPQRIGQLPITLVGSSETNYHSLKKTFENVVKPNLTPAKQAFILRYLGANSSIPNHLAGRLDTDLNLARDGFSGRGVMRLLATEPGWYEAGDQYAALTRYTSLSVSYILGWLNDGTGFSNLGNTGTGQVNTIAIAENGDFYIGGTFANWAGNADADRIAKYTRSTGAWSHLFASGASGSISQIIILDDGDLVIVGNYTNLGGASHNFATRWDGSTISDFGTGFDGNVLAVAFDYQRSKLYFGGSFDSANSVAAAKVVEYDLETATFTAMGDGFDEAVAALYVDPVTGDVFAGGEFTEDGTSSLLFSHAAWWDYSEQEWKTIGYFDQMSGLGAEGFNGTSVNSITSDGTYIYFGGDFTENGAGTETLTYARIARYLPGRFSHAEEIGGGVAGGAVYYLYWDRVLNKLLVSGAFTSVGGGIRLVDQAVYWNGSTFEKLPLNFPGSTTIYAFARNEANGDYFYGFNQSGTMIVPGALNSITNGGTDAAYPVFVFDSSTDVIGTEYATLTTLANRTTGALVNFNDLRILAGSIVTVEFAPSGARVYRLVGQSKVDLTAGAFTRDSDISAFMLEPGLNQILVAAMDTSGTPTISAYVLYRKRHWSLSGTAT